MTFPENGYSAAVIYLKFYKNLVEDFDEKFKIDINLYKKIVYSFNKKLAKGLLEGKPYNLPYNLGELSIKKKALNPKTAKLNIQHYSKTGEKIRHFNHHSEGYNARFYWKKKDSNTIGGYMFSFQPTYTNKRKLAAIMKTSDGHKNFLEI